jgi:mevalonate kinase
MKQTFYSNGKLLLTGEYLVLDGATALALPTKMGQDLQVIPQNKAVISWKSYEADGSLWLDHEITIASILNYQPTLESSVEATLLRILHHASLLQPHFLDAKKGFEIATRLTFPRKWGLGTSSTLINNVAQWFGVDAFQLLKNSFGGSGYDIACAQNDTPIFYRLEKELPIITPVVFHPKFAAHLYFVYLNQKQSSKESIAAYFNKKHQNLARNIEKINKLTSIVANAQDLKSFSLALQTHENELSAILEMMTVQESLFPDFGGVIKSLGAWGGDFVLVASAVDPTDYFNEKGFDTVISYPEMIL